MSSRGRNNNVQKICDCGRSRWAKCPHAWYFRFKPRGSSQRWQFSLDAELGRHIGSKTEAQDAATTIRAAILAGTFRRAAEAARTVAPTGVTLDQFAPVYIERASKASGKRTWKEDEHHLTVLREHRTPDGRRLGDVALSAITEDELEALYTAQRTAGRAASTMNHLVQVVKAAFRWAARKGYLARSPVSDDSALKRVKVAQRRRRLSPDEEQALLEAAGALTRGAGLRLLWLIIAAVESGARLGELLAVRWSDVNFEKHRLLIRAVEDGAKKTERARELPLSSRLLAVLEMAKMDPAGREYPQTAYVFGILGQRVRNINKAWKTCVLRAHGVEPRWAKGGKLSEESRMTLGVIDLHFHDLRHEAGCRWLEGGVKIHVVQQWLGHSNLAQTSTYLHADEMGSEESMRRFDAARRDASPGDFRGESVVNNPTIERRPLSLGKSKQSEKGLLH
jgi:integrase